MRITDKSSKGEAPNDCNETNADDNRNRNARPFAPPAMAILTASGSVALPIDRINGPTDPFVDSVRELRRRRLVQFLAETIARDLNLPPNNLRRPNCD